MNLTHAAEIAIAVSTIAGVVFGVFRFMQPRIAPYLRAIAALDTIPAQLDAISHELKPNGGGSMRDELRRVGRDVRINNATLRAYVENSAEGVFESGPDGACVYSNATYLRWTQCSFGEVETWGWLNCIAMSDRDNVREEWLAAVRDKREFRMRYAMVASDGSEFTVDTHAQPIRDRTANEVTGWVGHVRRRYDTGAQPAVRQIHQDNGA